MAGEIFPNSNLISPNFWGGLDIHSDDLEHDPETSPSTRLSRKGRELARTALARGLQEIYKGNATEVKYQPGVEFDPEATKLEDGSIIVIDSELLMNRSLPNVILPSPSIYTPFAAYWRQNITHQARGHEYVNFPDQTLLYFRNLNWGVIASDVDEERAVQLFPFDAPNLEKEGYISVSRSKGFYGGGLKTPIQIGNIGVSSVRDKYGGFLNTFHRFKGIDVVYPASGSRGRSRRKRLTELQAKFAVYGMLQPAPQKINRS